MRTYQILITNDDGIESPGLRAAAEAVMNLGHVAVVAPSHQQTGMGRSLTGDKQARLEPIDYHINGTKISAYHCDCSPALVVRHSLGTIFRDNRPDLLISGINYGENLGMNITGSGTIGAALEASSAGITAIAISKQTDVESHQKYTYQDWSASSHFLHYFSKSVLSGKILPDVEVLKIDVPHDATHVTPWKIAKLSQASYYSKVYEKPTARSRICDGKTEIHVNRETLDPDSDIYVFAIDKLVSVTPLSTDLTARVDFSALRKRLNE